MPIETQTMSQSAETSALEFIGENMLFLVGCPRSGTTWLQVLLATHPKTKTGRESRIFDYIGNQIGLWQKDLNSQVGLAAHLSEEEFLGALKSYSRQLLAPMLKELRPGELFLEKTPAHALHVSEIARFLPRAKVLHLVRDPRDVVASLLAASKTWARNWAPRRATRAARMWVQHVTAARKGAASIAPGQYLELHYEDLYRDPVETLRNVSRFLNLPWAEAEITQAIEKNRPERMREGKGTPIPLRGEHRRRDRETIRFPDFVRRAQPGGWRQDLSFLERWQVERTLQKLEPNWRRDALA